MRMTDKERAIIDFIIIAQRNEKSEAKLTEIADYIYSKRSKKPLLERPENWRTAMSGTLRNLSSKVEKKGCRLRRTSSLGRGRPAVYQFMGNFAKFAGEEK